MGLVIFNNLNDVMKFLILFMMVLMILMIIGGIYGMNVKLFGVGFVYVFIWLMLGMIIFCIISIEYL